jgi:hypothetical protein
MITNHDSVNVPTKRIGGRARAKEFIGGRLGQERPANRKGSELRAPLLARQAELRLQNRERLVNCLR